MSETTPMSERILAGESPNHYLPPVTITRAKPGSRGKDLEPTVLEKPKEDGEATEDQDFEFNGNGEGLNDPTKMGFSVYMVACSLVGYKPGELIVHTITREDGTTFQTEEYGNLKRRIAKQISMRLLHDMGMTPSDLLPRVSVSTQPPLTDTEILDELKHLDEVILLFTIKVLTHARSGVSGEDGIRQSLNEARDALARARKYLVEIAELSQSKPKD